jgi:hypothetical protein
VNLVYRPTSAEGASKDDEFSRRSIEERRERCLPPVSIAIFWGNRRRRCPRRSRQPGWLAGYRDTVQALGHPGVLGAVRARLLRVGGPPQALSEFLTGLLKARRRAQHPRRKISERRIWRGRRPIRAVCAPSLCLRACEWHIRDLWNSKPIPPAQGRYSTCLCLMGNPRKVRRVVRGTAVRRST